MNAMAAGAGLAPVEIVEVTRAADREAFLRLPWRIYAGDPAWVPPLLLDRKEFVSPKHPFLRHGRSALFVARRGGEVVGRIQASDDPRYNEAHGTNDGHFGLFECIDDPAVAHALLDAAATWCAAQGRSRLVGPVDYSVNYQVGVLIDGFHTPPRVMMNHNPPWYGALLESWGLRKAKDVYAWYYDAVERPAPERWRNLAERLARRSGVEIRPVDLKRFDSELEKIKNIYNSAWEQNWGAVRMTDAEFEHLAKELRLMLDPRLALMAEIDGEAVAFSLAIPDLNEALRIGAVDGKLFRWGLPIGLFKLLRARRHIKTARLVILGVLEGYRRRGITELLILRTIDNGLQAGYRACEMSWTLEDNVLINRPIEDLGSERYKTYRIYERAI